MILLGIAAIVKALAWPLVAAGALYLFRDAVTDFIKRVQKWEASPTGLKTEMMPVSQQNESLMETQVSNEIKASLQFSPLDPAYEDEYRKLERLIERNNSANLADHL